MTYSKFKLTQSQKTIYYDIDQNALYNDSGTLLALPPEQDASFYEEAKLIHGTRKKNNKPVALRILFGQACNYSCGYCMQKDLGNPDERPQNKDLQPFIDSLEKYLDLENLERVELWGGEPFLYWKDIMPVMQYLDKKGRNFFISTNGSPLRQKHVDFFASLEATVALGISHDGPGQEELRGEDIFIKESVADAIKNIDALYPKVQYSFNTVVSRTNYDLFKINDYFKAVSDKLELKNPRLSFTLGKIYDETNSINSTDHVINADEYKGFKEIANAYAEACIEQFKKHGKSKNLPLLQSNIFDGTTGILGYALSMRHQVPVTLTSSCGADAADVLSIDIQGNVRLCPHTSEKYIAGRIENLKSVRIIQIDLDRKSGHCSDCSVRRLCKSSCPIKFPDAVFLQNCRIEKIWYGAIQNASLKLIFGEPVELVGLGIKSIQDDQSITADAI